MYFSRLLAGLAALAVSVSAQSSATSAPAAASTPSISEIPTCALLCIVQAAPKVGCTVATDLGCLCPKFDELQTLSQPCVIAGCKAVTDQLKTIRITTGLCAQFNGAKGAAITSAEDAAQTSIIRQLGTGPNNPILPTGTNAIAYGLYTSNMPTTFDAATFAAAGATPTMGAVGAGVAGLVGLAAMVL